MLPAKGKDGPTSGSLPSISRLWECVKVAVQITPCFFLSSAFRGFWLSVATGFLDVLRSLVMGRSPASVHRPYWPYPHQSWTQFLRIGNLHPKWRSHVLLHHLEFPRWSSSRGNRTRAAWRPENQHQYLPHRQDWHERLWRKYSMSPKLGFGCYLVCSSSMLQVIPAGHFETSSCRVN